MKRAKAFTLIELVLAMAIAAGLAAALYAAMSTAWRAKKNAEDAVEPARAGAIAMDLICRDLDSAVTPASSSAIVTTISGTFQGIHQPAGAANNDDIQFRTVGRDEPADDNDPLSESTRNVEFLVRNDVNPPALVRRVTRNLLAAVQPNPDEEVLCRNVQNFSIQYFDGTQWQTDWDSTQLNDVLPLAVQITIAIADPKSPVQLNGQGVREITRVVPMPCGKPPG